MAELVTTHVPPPADIPQPDVLRFSDRAREGLEHAGFQIIRLRGDSLEEMRGRPKPLAHSLPTWGNISGLRSRRIEVAVDPTYTYADTWSPSGLTNPRSFHSITINRVGLNLAIQETKRNTRLDRAFLDDIVGEFGYLADYADLATNLDGIEVTSALFGKDHERVIMTGDETLPERPLPSEPKTRLPARMAALTYDRAVVVTDFRKDYPNVDSSLVVYPLVMPRTQDALEAAV